MLRRLIWAYDEAQSLDSMMIPNTRTVFGDSWGDVFGAGATYRGGIGKSEVMRVSYRVDSSGGRARPGDGPAARTLLTRILGEHDVPKVIHTDRLRRDGAATGRSRAWLTSITSR